jgi:putative phosphonate transport system ATP-binding protein
MTFNNNLMLQVKGLEKQFGDGCSHCQDRQNLNKNYCPVCGTVYALQDVGFDLYDQEVLGIVGESGSGKSTLVKCLYFDQETSGGEAKMEAFEGGQTDIFTVSNQKKRFIRNQPDGDGLPESHVGAADEFLSFGQHR